MMQRLTAITHHRFSLIRFRSPLLTDYYFLFLRVLRCFTSPFPPPLAYTFNWRTARPGFPIRKSSDRSPVIGSPRLIADSNVLHRLLMPRHPPCPSNHTQCRAFQNQDCQTTNHRTCSNDHKRCSRNHYIVLKQHETRTPTPNTMSGVHYPVLKPPPATRCHPNGTQPCMNRATNCGLAAKKKHPYQPGRDRPSKKGADLPHQHPGTNRSTRRGTTGTKCV